MSKAWLLLPLLLTGCGQSYRDADAHAVKVGKEIDQKGFAVVGKTPDGRPLLMTYVNVGHVSDRVYFAGNSITAVEDCGKSCVKSVTTNQ